ncbi:MAG: ArgE/DapE family deacylase [Acidimicrobiia bacterium]|nr:ArgE/DapE family deacylase [Acidimicrobiia bacterium]
MIPATDQHVDEVGVVEFTRDLVRTPTVFDPERGMSEAPAACLVATKMRSFGWEPVVEEVEPGRPNVIAVIEGGHPGRRLLFEGHTDVVTEGSRDEWTVDPFGAEVIDGRIYGRGSADMKSGVAAMILAVRAVELSGPFPGSIVVAALVDEEGGMVGVKDFLSRGHGSGIDAAIVCEPEENEICCVAKGAIRLGITVSGRMAHGAMPHMGVNPNLAVAALIDGLTSLEEQIRGQYGSNPHLGHTHITPTVVEGGDRQQHNVIPGRSWLGIDIRTTPEIDHATLLREIESLAIETGTLHETGMDIEVIEERPPVDIDESHPIATAVHDAHLAVEGTAPVFGGVPGTTDGTILLRDGGIPNVVYGPGPKWIAHQPDEYVEVSDIVNKTKVYARAALNFLNETESAP